MDTCPPGTGHAERESLDTDGCRRDVDAAVRDLDGVAATDVYDASEAAVTTSTVPEADARSVFELAGLDCRVCAGLVVAALLRLEAVSNATVSSGHGTLRVDYDPGRLTLADLRAELSALGYPVETTDEAFASRRESQWAEARVAAGILAGSMVLSSYLAVLYPIRFDFWFYGPEVVAFLKRALTSIAATHFYLNIAVLTGFVLLFTGRPVLNEAAAALRELSPNRALVVAAAAVALYLYSSLAAFWLVFDGGVYYDIVVALTVGATLVRQSGTDAPEAGAEDDPEGSAPVADATTVATNQEAD
jgi:Cu2+-exporting ATPase